MKGDWKEKLNYRKFDNEQLEKKIKELKYQIVLGQAGFGRVKVKDITEKGAHGSDVLKRLRKEIAKIKTVLSERRIKNG